jgi:RNA polymerase sigma-70 factor, ECF subfamily
VHALCRRICGHEADAQDATQEALISIVRGLPHFDERAAFTTWMYRVATNSCLDELRRRKRRPDPGLPEDDGTGGAAGSGSDRFPDRIAERLAVDAALADLPDDFRAAVVLRDLCDLDYAEIAEALDIPPGTVRSRIARARAHLARRLSRGNQREPADRPTPQP